MARLGSVGGLRQSHMPSILKSFFLPDLTLALASSIAHGDSSIVPSSQTIGTPIIPFKIDQMTIIDSTIIQLKRQFLALMNL